MARAGCGLTLQESACVGHELAGEGLHGQRHGLREEATQLCTKSRRRMAIGTDAQAHRCTLGRRCCFAPRRRGQLFHSQVVGGETRASEGCFPSPTYCWWRTATQKMPSCASCGAAAPAHHSFSTAFRFKNWEQRVRHACMPACASPASPRQAASYLAVRMSFRPCVTRPAPRVRAPQEPCSIKKPTQVPTKNPGEKRPQTAS